MAAWRLPLTVAVLVLVIVAVFSWVAYREVRSGAVAAAEQRATSLVGRLATLLAASADGLVTEIGEVATNPVLVEVLTRPSADAAGRAQLALQTPAEAREGVRVFELLNAAGDVAAAATLSDAASEATRGSGRPNARPGDTATVGGFRSAGEETRYAVTVPVRDGNRVAGHVLVEMALDATPETARQFAGLIGAAFKVGMPGGIWTDLAGTVEAPPGRPTDESSLWYATSDGDALLGARAPVPGTSWVAWVEIPADAVLERPRAFLAGIIPLGLVVVLVGAGVGGVLSQRSTAALLNSEERFRTLAAMAPDAIIAAGEDSRMTYVNPGAERIFGYTADKMLGQALTMLMPERFHDAHLGGVQRWVTTGEGRVIGRTVELTGLRADGSEFPLELSLAARWVDDRPRVIGIIRDVTERKRRDEELRRYSAELEVANEELEAFSYSVAHDLRAPLRAIHGFSQALLEDCHDGLDESGNHYLRRVCAAAERMALLIDDLLELSRATRAEMHRTRIDLSALAERAAADLAETAPERKVDVRIAPGLTALGDHKLLALVMGNLVGNAWKFTSAKDQAVIEVGHSAADDSDAGRAAFFVRDDGAGFDQTHADKLFSPFQRLHSRRDFDGNGVGLALVERIIRRHGGSVWGEGAEGEGATFYFTLPDP